MIISTVVWPSGLLTLRPCKRDYFPVWQPDWNGLFESYILSVSEDCVLYIDGGHIWSSPVSMPLLFLLLQCSFDNGNLVIRDRANSSMVIWQSFDNPSHVLLPGGHLGFSPITGKNTTLVTYSFLYNISYTLSLDATTKRGFIIQQSPGGHMFAGTFPEWIDIHEDGDYALAFNDVHTYMHLTSAGIIRFAKQWECDSILWSAPTIACGVHSYCGRCDLDSHCGPYSLCTSSGSCTCPVGFDSPSTRR